MKEREFKKLVFENFVQAKVGKQDYDNMNFICDLRPKELKGYSDEQIKNEIPNFGVHENFSEMLKNVSNKYDKLWFRILFDSYGIILWRDWGCK